MLNLGCFVVDASPPPAARAIATRALVDTVGVTLAGASEPVGHIVQQVVAADGAGPCRILGTALRSTASSAALANGTAAHAHDYDDMCFVSLAHPSAPLVAAALAAAERDHASGRVVPLGGRKRCGDERRARVRQRDEAHIVVVVRMRGGAVREGGTRRGRAQRRPQNAAWPGAVGCHHLLDDMADGFGRAGQRDPDRVDQRARRDGARGWRRRRIDDKAAEVQHSGTPSAAMNRRLMNT